MVSDKKGHKALENIAGMLAPLTQTFRQHCIVVRVRGSVPLPPFLFFLSSPARPMVTNDLSASRWGEQGWGLNSSESHLLRT